MTRSIVIVVVVLVGATLRIWRRRRRGVPRSVSTHTYWGPASGGVGLVAAREIRERVKSRIFVIGTLFLLAAVSAAIVIPTLNHSKATPQKVGVVGSLPASLLKTISSSAKSAGTTARVAAETSDAGARADLRAGRVDAVILTGRRLVVKTAITSSDTSTTAAFVETLATNLGIAEALQAAHLSPTQSEILGRAAPLKVASLQPGPPVHSTNPVSLIGVILIFVMLSQYNTWILIGVMEEKSSRVIEVLLATLRPIQMLTGKVLGIGLVAFAQAALLVGAALAISSAVGSTVIHGSAPLELLATLTWLVVGYAFYSWVYAAAGSMAERQDQVQTLAFPLSVPMLFGYIVSITGAASGSASLLLRVLAYLPPTAPFAMPVLVGRSDVVWWQFLSSVVISLVCTVGLARLAARVYRRAILRTGRRIRWREVVGRNVA